MYREPDFSKPSLAGAPECRFVPAPADTVLPDGFMSTTNFPIYVKVGGQWRMPERPRMDSHLVWDPAAERFKTDEVAPVVDYLADPLPTTSLVLVGGGGQISKRLSDAVKKVGHLVDAGMGWPCVG